MTGKPNKGRQETPREHRRDINKSSYLFFVTKCSSNCARLHNQTQPPRRRKVFLAHISMTSEQSERNSDTFLTGMHLAVITGDRFWADFAHLKQAY